MNTRAFLIILAALILLGGGYYWYVHGSYRSEPVPNDTSSSGKLDIRIVCEGALAYMSFPDAASAEKFVADCEAGEHPEVVERYKADRGYDGAAI